jgi:hypothetical protein
MVDVASDVGYLTVVAFAAEALADSTDSGLQPDMLPLESTVVLAPVNLPRDRPYAVAINDQQILLPRAASCRMTGGILYPPNDGSDAKPGDVIAGNGGVQVVAPQQAALDLANWYWEAQFQPPAGARWKTFTINFTGAPGDTVSLADAAVTMQNLNGLQLTQQPSVWVQSGTAINTLAKPGQFLLNTDTGDFYLIGA